MPMRLLVLLLAVACLFLGCPPEVAAQPAQRASAVKAAYLFKFPSFVEWPGTALQQASGTLTFGVAGDEAVAQDLEQLAAGRTLEGRRVAVVRVSATEVPPGLHVLFLGQQAESKVREAITEATGPVLIVTDQEGARRFGSVVNFMSVNGRVRFSISMKAAESRGLKLSSRLVSVAHEVEVAAP